MLVYNFRWLKTRTGLPWWSTLLESALQCREYQFNPWSGKIPHATGRACVCAKSLQSWLTLCDPMDYSLPVSSVLGILQARILEWVAMPFSRGSSWPRVQTHVSWGSYIADGFSTTEPPGNPTGLSCMALIMLMYFPFILLESFKI